MKPKLIFKTSNKNGKEPANVKNGMFLIYASKKLSLNLCSLQETTHKLLLLYPKNTEAILLQNRHDEIETIAGHRERIWIGILSGSLSENILIHRNKPFGFFVIEPGTNINSKYETAAAKNKGKNSSNSKKYRKKRTQSGGFLNRYDFAYAGRDVVNQLGKVAPGVITNVRSEINNVAEQRINQIISQGGKEIERSCIRLLFSC